MQTAGRHSRRALWDLNSKPNGKRIFFSAVCTNVGQGCVKWQWKATDDIDYQQRLQWRGKTKMLLDAICIMHIVISYSHYDIYDPETRPVIHSFVAA
jgi:hypothetical protein